MGDIIGLGDAARHGGTDAAVRSRHGIGVARQRRSFAGLGGWANDGYVRQKVATVRIACAGRLRGSDAVGPRDDWRLPDRAERKQGWPAPCRETMMTIRRIALSS